jgi:hypothetical protein
MPPADVIVGLSVTVSVHTLEVDSRLTAAALKAGYELALPQSELGRRTKQ